jgi:type I restriction enzyme S subunit
VKPGYKQTEVGVIPDEWEVKTFEKLFNFSGGYSASRDQLSSEGHCYLHYGDIHGATKTTVDVRADYQNIPKLNMPLKRVASKSLLEDGDVVFVDASEDDEGTSRHVVVVNKDKKPFISGLHTIVAKSKTDELVHEYRRYCFQTATIRQQFLFYAVGTKVSGISKTNIPKLKLPVPTIPEQRAIATALNDVDGLLGGLDRLIAKKRDLKQAAMQQLLTGQTRLPGFHSEWDVKRLGDVGKFLKGSGVTKDQTRSGSLACVRYGELYTHHNDVVRHFHSWISPEVAATAVLLKKGDILFAGSGETKEEIGKCAAFVTDIEAYAGGDIVILRPDNSDSLFLGYYLNTGSIARQKASRGQGDAVVHISSSALSDVRCKLPPQPEQTAIAEVLTHMDGELAVLEQRREKTRALKQAMMQELLTGRIRLVGKN